MKYTNPEIPEGINTSKEHPLKEFAFLVTVVLVGVIALTAVLSLSVDWAAKYIPFEFETKLSEKVAAKLNKESNEVDTYLQSIADKITPHMDLPDDMKISVHYVNDNVVNAMATLGGHVMVYRGLLEQMPDENTLVMLLGHEIGHVKLRHPVKALGKGVVLSLLLKAVLGNSSDSVGDVLSDTSMITMLTFNRDMEQASDEEGLMLLHAYYGQTQGAATLFEILATQEQGDDSSIPEFLRTHPETKDRIAHINQIAQANGWALQGETKPMPSSILQKLASDKRVAREERDAEK